MRLCWLLAVLSLWAVPAVGQEAVRPVRFDRDISPLLTQRCGACHGVGTAEAGLQFIDLEHATRTLESGLAAIVPGQPDESELILRVTASDSSRMPPKGPPLTAQQIELLKRWIAQGAKWPDHWAYRPLHPVEVPPVAETLRDTARGPIDAFILKELTEAGLSPSEETNRRTWLRRVTVDLHGLTPTPEDLAAFAADQSPEAYERVVTRLLASPRYGERWARHWMDLVHFAETHGHDQDRPRPHAWPYRDYLIESFNSDKPYPRFVAEQVAGDGLWPDEPAALVATGFLATGPWDESSLRDIQNDTPDREIARYLDRDDIVTTVMSTFMAATVHCARCHDHKFDPIKQTEYYGLQAVFAGTGKGDRPYDADVKVAAQRSELRQRQQQLARWKAEASAQVLTTDVAAHVAEFERRVADERPVWTPVSLVKLESREGATLTQQADGSVLAGGPKPDKDVYVVDFTSPLARVTGVKLEVLTDESLAHLGPGRQDNGNLHLNQVVLSTLAGETATKVPLTNAQADFNQEGWSIGLALDDNPDSAWGIYPQVGQPHRATFETAAPLECAGQTLRIELHQIHGRSHLIGKFRLWVTDRIPPLPLEADLLPNDITRILALPVEQRSQNDSVELAVFVESRLTEQRLAALPPPSLIYSGSNAFLPDKSHAPVPIPRQIFVLKRGEISQPGAEAQPAALSLLAGVDASLHVDDVNDDAARRAALARWLTRRDNVLTWRVLANRIWQWHFGRGLSDTPNDFGRMGNPPSHPELLDWLACRLRDGASLKTLHRDIVLSATYRQASAARPELAARDADNRLWARMPRTRLDAETVRDSILQLAGKLDLTMGGPSVKQFIESPGVQVTPNVDYEGFNVDDPANHRRSVYRFLFRTISDPFMDVLDCADSSQLTPKRTESVTPLQALALLNDRFVIRQSEHLAARLVSESNDLDTQVRGLFSLVLLRAPTDSELSAVQAYAQKHGLANAARMLLNTNEFVFAD